MTPVLSVTLRDSKQLSYFPNDPDRAAREYLAAQKDPDVVAVSGGYLVCDVQFLDDVKERTYTYHCSQWYKAGTKVWVPTTNRSGQPCDKQVRIIRTYIATRQDLEKKCPFDRYKAVCEDKKPLTASGWKVAEHIGVLLLQWFQDDMSATKELVQFFSTHPDCPKEIMEVAEAYANAREMYFDFTSICQYFL